MTTMGEKKTSSSMTGTRWSSMLGLSLAFHLAMIFVFLFVPEAIPTRRFDDGVYSVNLVEMPRKSAVELKESKNTTERKKKVVVTKDAQAQRISQPKNKERPLVIAKKTVKAKKPSVKKSEISPSERIDKAISKIESKVKQGEETEDEQESHLQNALVSLENRFGGPGSDRTGQSIGDISMQIYMMELYDRIYSNYAYSAAFQNRKDRKATIILTVKRDGSILKKALRKPSGDALFDDLAMNAVEKSDPLPPLPEGYKKSYDKIEIEIIFNPQDLQNS